MTVPDVIEESALALIAKSSSSDNPMNMPEAINITKLARNRLTSCKPL